MAIILRGSTLYLKRRTPRRYALVERRGIVWISLHTDNLAEAGIKAETIWQSLTQAWEAKLAGRDGDAETQYQAARDLAQARGMRFRGAGDVGRLDWAAFHTRLDPAVKGERVEPTEATALLGGAKVPPITVSRALELYWPLVVDRLQGKSADQMRRWRNPRLKAVRNFIKVIGDRELAQISADDMLDFRTWWTDRIARHNLTANSANKDLNHLAEILRTIVRLHRLNIDLPLGGLSLKEGDSKSSKPFSVDWISRRLLGKGALDRMNPEARGIFLGMINTGYRPSEGSSLLPHHIRLDADIPHISIEPEGRTLKTRHSRRTIPLAGISLAAFQASPNGFPRYHNSPTISATVNSFLRENGLMESPDHTFYGLRHSFEDRLLAQNVPDRLAADLMGHATRRERYGSGATLEQKLTAIQAIAL